MENFDNRLIFREVIDKNMVSCFFLTRRVFADCDVLVSVSVIGVLVAILIGVRSVVLLCYRVTDNERKGNKVAIS